MFAHAIGMGLFEQEKLRWLEDSEWKACGYIVNRAPDDSTYRLTREPLRRFEDVDNHVPSVLLEPVSGKFIDAAALKIVTAVRELAQQNPTLAPDDIGIIILDRNADAFSLADKLTVLVQRELGWPVNKAHETKRRIPNHLFVSNKNNVKGLEFPFVICVSEVISRGYVYRNSLYMTLTRSFLQTRMIVSGELNKDVLPQITQGLNRINSDGVIEVEPPNEATKAQIKTTITYAANSLSFFDMADKAFIEIGVLPLLRDSLLDALKKVIGEEPDMENILETSRFMYQKMLRNKA
jgi:superfamily I DNA and RNA helicase